MARVTEKYIEIIDRVCPVCQKNFIPAVEHVYRRDEDGVPVCSWSCLCAYRRSRKKQRGRMVRQYDARGALVGEWPNASNAAAVLGCDPADIRKCLRRERLNCGGYIWRYADEESDIGGGEHETPDGRRHDDVLVGCLLQSNADAEDERKE